MTTVQNMSERKVIVVERPTASPVILGWKIPWMTKLMIEYKAMTHTAVTQPESTRAITAGGMTPMTNPMFGM